MDKIPEVADSLWARVLIKAAVVAILLVFLWAFKDKDSVVIYMRF
jgi:hypothetical protein